MTSHGMPTLTNNHSKITIDKIAQNDDEAYLERLYAD